jgi:hypothetical protein
LQKTLDKVSQRHSEDFIHGFLKPLFKKDFTGIIDRYPLEDWQEALTFIVYNLDDSQSQSDCLQLLRNRIQEAVDQTNPDPLNASERNTQRRETVSNKVTLPSETLLYLDLFQNDINNTVKHLLDQLEGLTSDNAQQMVNVFEYLLFIKDSQCFSVEHEKLQALILEFSNLLSLSGHSLMSYFVLDSLGQSNNYCVQKAKHNIWVKHNAQISQHFAPPVNPCQAIWFPRKSLLRPAPVQVQTNTSRNQNNNSKRNGKPTSFVRGPNKFGKPLKPINNKTSPFNIGPAFPSNKPTHIQPPPVPVMKKKPKPPGKPNLRPSFPGPAPSTSKPAPPTRPTPGNKKNKTGPPMPPKTGLIPKPPTTVLKPTPSKPMQPPPKPVMGSSTLQKKVAPSKPTMVKPPPPKRPTPATTRPAPPSQRMSTFNYFFVNS